MIIVYDDAYKEKMIAMVQEARLALKLESGVRADLYDVKANYLDRGDGFFLALDDGDNVVGCLGFSVIGKGDEAFLHRFYVKASLKRQGIGSGLLQKAEEEMRKRGVSISRVHLGEPRETWFESYAFYPKHGYREYAPRYMMKELSYDFNPKL